MTNDETTSPRTHGLSKTAVWVAAGRAIGAREPDPSVRNPDVLAEPLLGDAAALGLDHPVVDALQSTYDAAMRELEVAGLVRAMNIRTRFIGDALERAMAAGAAQVLILGAGFDSHAYRYRELLAGTRVFEVDRPTTQAFKRRRVDSVLGGPPPNLAYVPLDLESEEMAVTLARHGYDATERTVVIMEGLTMYLREEALRELLGFLAAHAPGSSIVFDFATETMVAGLQTVNLSVVPQAARKTFERFMEMIKDEPWLFGFPVGEEEEEYLAELGLKLRELLTIGSEESVKRYLTRADGTTVGGEAQARAEQMRAAALGGSGRLSAEQREQLAARMREQQRLSAYRIAEAVVARCTQ